MSEAAGGPTDAPEESSPIESGGDPQGSNPGAPFSIGEAGRRRLLLLAYLVIVVAASWHFSQVRFQLTAQYKAQAPVTKLIDYEADRPFQYRVLMSILINAVPVGVFPTIKARLFAFEFLATMGIILAFRQWLRRFFVDGTLCSLLSLLIVPCLHYNFVLARSTPLWFPSDIPSVFFFTLGLLLIQEKRWTLFYPLFVVATLNRETSCFLTLIYCLAYLGEYRTRTYWMHLVGQTAIWFAIKIALFLRFADNGGRFVYDHFDRNLSLLATPINWPALLSSLGFTGVIAVLGYPYLRHPFIRRAMLVLIPFGVGMFLVGRIIEVRIFGELIPLTLCATILITAEIARNSRPTSSNP